jgi:hypothetical protein
MYCYSQENCNQLLLEHIPQKLRFNPDSILIDTCGTSQIPNELRSYAKKTFQIAFKALVFRFPSYQSNTAITFTLNEIDSNYVYDINEGLLKLKEKFGDYIIENPEPEIIDSISFFNRSFYIPFYITFENYVNISEALDSIRQIKYVSLLGTRYINKAFTLVSNVDEEKRKNEDELIYPNPCREIINIKLNNNKNDVLVIEIIDAYSRLLNHYSILLQNENILKFNVSTLPYGIYFVKIYNKDLIQLKLLKFFKQY